MSQVIHRYSETDEKDRVWYYYSCFCGSVSRFLNTRAMIRESQKHKKQHEEKEVEVVDDYR